MSIKHHAAAIKNGSFDRASLQSTFENLADLKAIFFELDIDLPPKRTAKAKYYSTLGEYMDFVDERTATNKKDKKRKQIAAKHNAKTNKAERYKKTKLIVAESDNDSEDSDSNVDTPVNQFDSPIVKTRKTRRSVFETSVAFIQEYIFQKPKSVRFANMVLVSGSALAINNIICLANEEEFALYIVNAITAQNLSISRITTNDAAVFDISYICNRSIEYFALSSISINNFRHNYPTIKASFSTFEPIGFTELNTTKAGFITESDKECGASTTFSATELAQMLSTESAKSKLTLRNKGVTSSVATIVSDNPNKVLTTGLFVIVNMLYSIVRTTVTEISMDGDIKCCDLTLFDMINFCCQIEPMRILSLALDWGGLSVNDFASLNDKYGQQEAATKAGRFYHTEEKVIGTIVEYDIIGNDIDNLHNAMKNHIFALSVVNMLKHCIKIALKQCVVRYIDFARFYVDGPRSATSGLILELVGNTYMVDFRNLYRRLFSGIIETTDGLITEINKLPTTDLNSPMRSAAFRILAQAPSIPVKSNNEKTEKVKRVKNPPQKQNPPKTKANPPTGATNGTSKSAPPAVDKETTPCGYWNSTEGCSKSDAECTRVHRLPKNQQERTTVADFFLLGVGKTQNLTRKPKK